MNEISMKMQVECACYKGTIKKKEKGKGTKSRINKISSEI